MCLRPEYEPDDLERWKGHGSSDLPNYGIDTSPTPAEPTPPTPAEPTPPTPAKPTPPTPAKPTPPTPAKPTPPTPSPITLFTFPDKATQLKYVASCINSRRHLCAFHSVSKTDPIAPHSNLYHCDKFQLNAKEYTNFKIAMQGELQRCFACACPKIDDFNHKMDAKSTACKNEELRDWLKGLSFIIWKVPDIRQRIFTSLGLTSESFNSTEKYAKWLADISQRSDKSTYVSNLIDLLYVFFMIEKELKVSSYKF
jgi:hypothetical protein